MANVLPTDIPTEPEANYWSEEIRFMFGGSPGGAKIPRNLIPPIDLIDYVLAKYRETVLNIHIHSPGHPQFVDLHPSYKWAVGTICLGHFLWFATRKGARWVMGLYGVQEVNPFKEAYAYFWVRPGAKDVVSLIGPTFGPVYRNGVHVDGLSLRIYRYWEKNHSAACSQANLANLTEMRRIVQGVRCAPHGRDIPPLGDDMWIWVSEMIRNWMIESEADDHWPYRKGGRMTGTKWVQSVESAPGVPLYEPLKCINEQKGERVYRISEPRIKRTAAHWCGGSEIRIVPVTDLHRMQKGHDEPALREKLKCKSCRTVRPCVPFTGEESHRCCSCHGIQVETGERPTLDKCTMNRECKSCPSRIDSNTDLIALKTRLNSSPGRGTVPR